MGPRGDHKASGGDGFGPRLNPVRASEARKSAQHAHAQGFKAFLAVMRGDLGYGLVHPRHDGWKINGRFNAANPRPALPHRLHTLGGRQQRL